MRVYLRPRGYLKGALYPRHTVHAYVCALIVVARHPPCGEVLGVENRLFGLEPGPLYGRKRPGAEGKANGDVGMWHPAVACCTGVR